MNGPYGLILADPPWAFRDRCNDGKRGSCHKYPVMSVKALCALPVSDNAAPDCLLAMWWVGAMPAEALQVVSAWGFRLATMTGLTWVKHTKDRTRWHMGMGHYTRANAENCLFAVRGHPRRANAGVRQLIVALRRDHSRKPDEAYERLERLMGDVPRIELFARRRRPGWDAWGNEIEGSIDLSKRQRE